MAVGRHARRRRSVLKTPAFVDRIDLPDDAAGRVVLFSVEVPPGHPDLPRRRPAPAPLAAVAGWLGSIADDPLGAVVIGIALVLILVIGLRVTT